VEFDPYAVLGVSRDATSEQIANARHQLVRQYHPDVNPAPDAAARFDEVQQAFDLLSDPAARAEYDRAHGEPAAAAKPGPAASRFSVYPSSVDFGVTKSGWPSAWRDVTVSWAGVSPGRITTNSGSEWWTVTGKGWLSSGIVFHLQAYPAAGEPSGQRQAELRVTVDDTVITVPLTTEIDVTSHPAPSPREEKWFAVIVSTFILAGIAWGIFWAFNGSANHSGGSVTPTASPAAPMQSAKVPQP
jgi:hypothetical protein